MLIHFSHETPEASERGLFYLVYWYWIMPENKSRQNIYYIE